MPRHVLLLAPAVTACALLVGCSSGSAVTAQPTSSAPDTQSSMPSPSTAPTRTPSSTPVLHLAAPHSAGPTRTHTPPATPTDTPTRTPATSQPPTAPSRPRLPLRRLGTEDARQVITVTAGSTSDTQATLQRWRRTPDGWRRVGPATPARLGSAGMSTHASEQSTATPIGSFTLTRAFGHDANPGTALPYRQTTPADWWISQPGPLYNTLQHCTSECAFTQGDPNEHLYYETPYYDYAVVIDYNTRNAGRVVPGAGSAFFLHVSVDPTTQGCVSIAADQLVRTLRWLRPAAHPRILIGTDR